MMEAKIVAVALCTLGNLLAYIVAVVVGATGKDLFDAGMISISFEIVLFLISLVIFAT